MMKIKLTVTGMFLVIAILACTNPFDGGLAEADQIATVVAETLTANGIEGAGDDLPDPAETPGFDEPDRLRVAYVDNGNLVIWTEGIGAAVVYRGNKVSEIIFSGDGNLVVFKTVNVDYFFAGLWAVNTDGTNLRHLLDAATVSGLSPLPEGPNGPVGASIYHWQFVPRTHTLAFNTNLQFMGPGLLIQDDLRLLDVDAGTLSTLFDVDQGGMFYYSPDGSKIAVVKPGEIDLVNADGSNRRNDVLTHPHVNTASEYSFYAIPRWHSDGSQLKVTIPSAEPFGDSAAMAVWTIPVDGSPAVMLGEFSTDMALFPNGKYLAPDLDRLAYVFRVDEGTDNIWDLRTANLDGSGEVTLTTGPLQFHSWNPSGDWLAFREEGELFVVNAAGGAVQPLADVQPAFEMAWVDSGRFLYFSRNDVGFDIRIGSFDAPSYSIGSCSGDFPAFDISN